MRGTNMSNNLAPVGVSTYIRLGHLQRTIAALQMNTLAKDSELYIFSDAPKLGDEAKVENVREYIHTITGFKKLHIRERLTNNRVANNRGGIEEVLEKYGKIIFLEEDVVTASGFLLFMNDALHRYEKEKKVFSITGWCPLFFAEANLAKGSSFFVPRFSGWGLGIWKDRYEKIKKISVEDVASLKQNSIALARVYEQMGADVFTMIQAEALEKTNALDVRCCYYQAITGKLTLYPYPTLTRNIGLDGTGEHCGNKLTEINGEFGMELINEHLFPEDVLVNEKVAKIFAEGFTHIRPLFNKTIELLIKIGIYQYLRPIVKKIQHQFKGILSAK